MFEVEMQVKMRDGTEKTIPHESIKRLGRELGLDTGSVGGVPIAGLAHEYFVVQTTTENIKFPRSPENDAAVIEFLMK